MRKGHRTRIYYTSLTLHVYENLSHWFELVKIKINLLLNFLKEIIRDNKHMSCIYLKSENLKNVLLRVWILFALFCIGALKAYRFALCEYINLIYFTEQIDTLQQ